MMLAPLSGGQETIQFNWNDHPYPKSQVCWGSLYAGHFWPDIFDPLSRMVSLLTTTSSSQSEALSLPEKSSSPLPLDQNP